MKKYLYKSFFTLLLCLGACTSEDVWTDEQPLKNDGEISKIEAVVAAFDWEDLKSRNTISMGSFGEFVQPVWADRDTIGIYPTTGDQLSFPIVDGVGTSTCEFNGGGWALKASSKYTAYYPFNRQYYRKNSHELPISMLGQKQVGNDNSSHLGAYDIQIAKGTTPSSGKISFAFEHKVAIVRMDLVTPRAGEWTAVTLESEGAFTTKAKMDLTKEIPEVIPTATSSSVELVLENVKTTTDDRSLVVYMMMLPVNLTGKSLNVKLTDKLGNVYETSASVVNDKYDFKASSARWITAHFNEAHTYHVESAGTLSSLIDDDLKYSLTSLKLTGELSSADISLIRNMAGSDYLGNETEGKLVELDLSEASIVTENNNSFYYMDFYNQTYSTNANEIGKYMFYKTKLKSILLPETITNIGSYAFGYAINLSGIILPNGIKEIPYGAFRESGITSIVIPEGVEMIDTDAFYKCYGLQSVTLPNTLKCLKSYCFGHSGITSLTIPSSVNTIEMYVLANTNQLSEVIVLDGELKELPNHFLYNSAVSSISIPGNVQKIGDSAFQECANLKSIIIPEGVQSIGSYSFKNSGLMEVVIPSSVKSISTEAFSAAKLAEIHCLSKTSPVADTYTFVYDYNAEWQNRITLYVPKGCSNIYKANSPWKYFKNIVEE